MRFPAVLSTMILLGLAAPVQGAPLLFFQNAFTDRHSIVFGMDYFTAEVPYEENSWPDRSIFTAGVLQITSGALRDVTVLDEFDTLYRYRQGQLRLNLEWVSPTGSPATGWLTARLPALDVLIEERDRSDPDRPTTDYPRTIADYALTRGRLSPSLAALLDVSRHTGPVTLDWWLENVENLEGPPPPFGTRVAHHIVADQLRVSVQTKAVPEPSVLQLAVTVVASVGVSLWRRRRPVDRGRFL